MNDWEVKTKDLLVRLQQEAPQEGLAHGLAQYTIERRPFALANQSPQNENKLRDRFSDLVCGVPFTSNKHPWPKDGANGMWMQPILQISFDTFKDVLQVDWGTGLLQVWARIEKDSNNIDLNIDPLIVRIIPSDDTEDPIDTFIPNWKADEGAKFFSFFDYSSFAGNEVFEWYRAGEMYGTRQQLFNFCYDKVADFGDEEFEWLDAVMESLSNSPLCGEGYSDFLGGWGGSHGEQDAAYGDGLVLRVSDGDGAVVALHRQSSKSKNGTFIASYSLR